MAMIPRIKIEVEREIISYDADTGELVWTETLLVEGEVQTIWTMEHTIEQDKLDAFWEGIDEHLGGALAELKRDGVRTDIGTMRFE